MSGRRLGIVLGTIAVALCLLEWCWLSWRFSRRDRDLSRRIDSLTAEVARLQVERLPTTRRERDNPRDNETLRRALKRLGKRNVLERYQAGLTIREFGDRAVPDLIEMLRQGDSRSRDSALLVLADLGSPKAVRPLRELAEEVLDQSGGETDEKTAAGILAMLAKARDEDSLDLFRKGAHSPSEAVRAASLAGLRRLGAVEALPQLAERLGKEPALVGRELERTIKSFCLDDPSAFAETLQEEGVPAAARFKVMELLGSVQSAAASQSLRIMTRDKDPRIALTAAHMLAKRGDQSGKEVAERLSRENANTELRKLAEDVLKTLQ